MLDSLAIRAALVAAAVACAAMAEPSSARAETSGGGFLAQVITPVDPMAAPQASILLPGGEVTNLAAYDGEVRVVLFWATWCHVCKIEMPHVEALAAELADEGVRILPLSVDEGDGALALVEDYYADAGFEALPVMIDAGGLHSRILGARMTPTAFVFDRAGDMAAILEGPADWSDPAAAGYLRALAAR